jgi:hypothetical protein
MADSSVVTNGQTLTEEQYKQLCKQVRQHQLAKNKGKKRAKPILKPIGDINVIDVKAKVQKSPVDWDDIKNGMPFALDPNGTLLYTKAGANKAFCLNTMSPIPVGGASVYRVFL